MPTVSYLQYLRLKGGMSRKQLAEKIDKSASYVMNLEHGTWPIPTKLHRLLNEIFELDGEVYLGKIEVSEQEYLEIFPVGPTSEKYRLVKIKKPNRLNDFLSRPVKERTMNEILAGIKRKES